MVILEAIRIGMPVIATDVGGISEQIEDGLDGLHSYNSKNSQPVESISLTITEVDVSNGNGTVN